ncbi:MAG: response regulator transcription factor [Lachnospiraceae bacterium]|jgi:DNA-binding NarL/FixJ family response regulator|nr:response regulator transcription factor [Lachnospiraceae bacterium]
MQQVSVVIVDDHVMVREGIKQLLEMDGDIRVIGEASDGEEGIKVFESTDPDVILLDVNMPKMNGLEVLQHIKETGIKRKVLILTIHNEVEYLLKAIEIGVDGYVLKDSELAVLRKAIFSINDGNTYIQPSLAPLLKQKLQEPADLNDDGLTKREIEVLKLIAQGLYNKEIADTLSISEKTVKNHVSNIFRKINVSDRTQAAVFAIKNGYVEL